MRRGNPGPIRPPNIPRRWGPGQPPVDDPVEPFQPGRSGPIRCIPGTFPPSLYIMSRIGLVSCIDKPWYKRYDCLFPGRKRGLFKPKNNGPRQTGTQRTLTTYHIAADRPERGKADNMTVKRSGRGKAILTTD